MQTFLYTDSDYAYVCSVAQRDVRLLHVIRRSSEFCFFSFIPRGDVREEKRTSLSFLTQKTP